MKECEKTDYVVNFSSYALRDPEIIDNSGLMALRLLRDLSVKEVYICGMDGYSLHQEDDYYQSSLDFRFPEGAMRRNRLISAELRELGRHMSLKFLTPTEYEVVE